jgi:uncharacterized protein (UPF0276 family)
MSAGQVRSANATPASPAQLGVGLTFHRELEAFLEVHSDLVDVLELEPQTLWLPAVSNGHGFRTSDGIMERIASFPQAKLVHSVGLPVGGTRLGDFRQLPLLRDAIRRLGSPWCSEHLSFNVAAGPRGSFFTGFLLPPRQTWEGVERAAGSVRRVADEMCAPLAIETGVSYLRVLDYEMSDAQFVTAVSIAADCGILLDVHNIWANERNQRQTADSYLGELPLDRVWELHLAGGQEHAGFWLDAHSAGIPDEVLRIAWDVVPHLPNLGAIIFELMPEQFDRLGPDELRRQLESMQQLWARRRPGAVTRSAPAMTAMPPATTTGGPDPRTWEDTLGALAVGIEAQGDLAKTLALDPGVDVVRTLVAESRASMLSASLRMSMRLLLLHLGEQRVRELMQRFWQALPPEAFAADEGVAFGEYLRASSLDLPYLDDVLDFELAVLHATVTGAAATLHFCSDPAEVLGALADGRLPSAASDGDYTLEVSGAPV